MRNGYSTYAINCYLGKRIKEKGKVRILRNLLFLEVKEIIYYRLFCLELVALSIEECAISSSFGWSCKRINSLPFSCNLILNVNSKILPQMERFIEVTERVRTCMFVSICTDIYDTDKLNY